MRSWFKTRIGRGEPGDAEQQDGTSTAAGASAAAAGGFGAVEDLSTPRFDPRAAAAADAGRGGMLRRAPSMRSVSLDKHFQGSVRDMKQLAEELMDGDSSVQTEDFLAVLETDDQSMDSSALAFDESKYAAAEEDDDDDDDDDTESRGSVNSDLWKSKRATSFLKDLMGSSNSSLREQHDDDNSRSENDNGEADESDNRTRTSVEDGAGLNDSGGSCDGAQSPASASSAPGSPIHDHDDRDAAEAPPAAPIRDEPARDDEHNDLVDDEHHEGIQGDGVDAGRGSFGANDTSENNSNEDNSDGEDDSYRSRDSHVGDDENDNDDVVESVPVAEQNRELDRGRDGNGPGSPSGPLSDCGNGIVESRTADGGSSCQSEDAARVVEGAVADARRPPSQNSSRRSLEGDNDSGGELDECRESSFSSRRGRDSLGSEDQVKDAGSFSEGSDKFDSRDHGSPSRHHDDEGLPRHSVLHSQGHLLCDHGEGNLGRHDHDVNVGEGISSSSISGEEYQEGESSLNVSASINENDNMHPSPASDHDNPPRDPRDASSTSRLYPSSGNDVSDDSPQGSTRSSYDAGQERKISSADGDGESSFHADNVTSHSDIDGSESHLSMESEGKDKGRPSLQNHLPAEQESISSIGETSMTLEELMSPSRSSPARPASPDRSPDNSRQDNATKQSLSPSDVTQDDPVELIESEGSIKSGCSRQRRLSDEPRGDDNADGSAISNEQSGDYNEANISRCDSRYSTEDNSISSERGNDSPVSGHDSRFADCVSERSEREGCDDSRTSGYDYGGEHEPHVGEGSRRHSEGSSISNEHPGEYNESQESGHDSRYSSEANSICNERPGEDSESQASGYDSRYSDELSERNDRVSCDDSRASGNDSGGEPEGDGNDSQLSDYNSRKSSSERSQLDGSESSRRSADRRQSPGADMHRTDTEGYPDSDHSNPVTRPSRANSNGSFDQGTLLYGESRDIASLTSESSHSLRVRNLAAPGMDISSHRDKEHDEPQYEFDLEKVIADPSERRRGIRRKISFTQSFSSVNSDDSNVFGLSKLVRRRGGKRTNSMRLVPRPSNQPNGVADLSTHLSQPDQVPASFAFDEDDVSRLGDSFGVSNANFALGASIADFGESFANVNSYSYHTNRPAGSARGLSPTNEDGIADPETDEDSGRKDDDSESTLSGASRKEESGIDDAQSLSYRSDDDSEENLDVPDDPSDPEVSDEAESKRSNSSAAEVEPVAAVLASTKDGDKRTEGVSDGNSAAVVGFLREDDVAGEANDIDAPSHPKPQPCDHPVSTLASADATAPLSEYSFSSSEDERSLQSSPSDDGKESLATAIQFLTSDLDSPKLAAEHVLSSLDSLQPVVQRGAPPEAPDGKRDDANDVPSYISSESEVDSDDGSDTDGSKDPAKLVIKEAPLLRLENVTAQTRSTIPESKLKNKSVGAGNGGWGWSLFGKKAARPPTEGTSELPRGSSHGHPEEPGLVKTTFATSPHERSPAKTMPPASGSQRKVDVAPNLSSDSAEHHGSSNSQTASSLERNPPTYLDIAPQQFKLEANDANPARPGKEYANASVKREEATETLADDVPSSSPETRSRETPVTKSTETQPALNAAIMSAALIETATRCNDNAPSSTSPPPATQHVSPVAPAPKVIQVARASLLLSESVESPPVKKNKTKKSKEKKELTSHIERRRRQTNRHGDEVSVGTMNFQPRVAGTQFVVPNLFDEVSAAVEKRPWEKALTMRKSQKVTHDSSMKGLDFIVDPALERDDEGALAPACIENNSDAKDVDKVVSELPEATAPTLVQDEHNPGSSRDKNDDDSDELLSLHGLQELEMKFEDERRELDFDDMWNNVDCDSKTKLEFEERKRGKEREQERKRIQREKARAAKRSKATKRLKLFEKHELEEGYAVKQSAALSSELLSALHRVFDEDAADEAGSGSDDEQSTVAATTDGTLRRSGESVMSLYLTSDKSVSKVVPVAPSDSEDDDPSNAEMDGSVRSSRSKRMSGKKLRRKGNSSRGSRTASRRRKPHVDPAAIFEAELKRQQRVKTLTVLNLRQEMSDRRGASVRLIQKEFAERKYKRGSGTFQHQTSPRQSFAGTSPQKQRHFSERGDHSDPFAPDVLDAAPSSPWRRSPRRLVGGRTASQIADARAANPGRDLASHLSRWDVGGTVTDLDDLMTVQMSPPKANFLTVAADLAANAASHLPSVPDLPPVPNLAVPSMPGMPNLSGAASAIQGTVATNFGFAATFADMPLTTIAERADDDDENEAGLLDGGWDDDDHRHPRQGGTGGGGGGAGGGGGLGARSGPSSPLRSLYGAGPGGGRFSISGMKVPKAPASVASAAGKGLGKLKSVARLVPKLSIRGPGDGSGRQMTMLDDDDRGLLG